MDWELAALACAGTILLGYPLATFVLMRGHRRRVFAAHIDAQRVVWAEYVIEREDNRVLATQTFRTAVMVVSFFLKTCLAAMAATMPQIIGMSTWLSLGGMRVLLPSSVLVYALLHFCFSSYGMYHLHFHTQVVQQGVVLDPAFKVDEARSRMTALLLSVTYHSRMGWRALSLGLVLGLWSIGPVALVVGTAVLVSTLYANDFLFDDAVESDTRTPAERHENAAQ